MSDLITDAMVETAAKARWDYGREDAGDMTEWEMRYPAFREGDTEAMRAAIEAAAPRIAAKALRDAASEYAPGLVDRGYMKRYLTSRADRIERGES